MDPLNICSLDKPVIPVEKTKNILVLLESGKLEYRDVPIGLIFSSHVQKFEKWNLKVRKPIRDKRIAYLYMRMQELIKEAPELACRLPIKPLWMIE